MNLFFNIIQQLQNRERKENIQLYYANTTTFRIKVYFLPVFSMKLSSVWVSTDQVLFSAFLSDT